MDRKILISSDGMILNNGEIYGKTIYLADGEDESAFKEITQEEYEKLVGGVVYEDLCRCRA